DNDCVDPIAELLGEWLGLFCRNVEELREPDEYPLCNREDTFEQWRAKATHCRLEIHKRAAGCLSGFQGCARNMRLDRIPEDVEADLAFGRHVGSLLGRDAHLFSDHLENGHSTVGELMHIAHVGLANCRDLVENSADVSEVGARN